MTDTTYQDTPVKNARGGTGKHYGQIPDRLAWDLDLGGDVTADLGFQVFTGQSTPEAKRAEALARSSELGMYRARYRAGSGENGLHSHPGDSIWLVLAGPVQFYAEKSRLVADLGPGGGVMIPSGATYRFPMRRGQRTGSVHGDAAVTTGRELTPEHVTDRCAQNAPGR